MHCQTYQTWILRETSDELGAFRSRIVARHCCRCQACADFRAAIPDLETASRRALDIGDAGKNAAAHVVLRAAPIPRRRAIPVFPLSTGHAIRPAIAAAALFLVFLGAGVWVVTTNTEDGALPHAQQPTINGFSGLAEPEYWELEADLIADMLLAWEQEARQVFATQEGLDLRDELEELARELIRLEDSA